MLRNSELDYKLLLDSLIQPGSRWLDVGCGISILPLWIRDSIDFQLDLISRCEVALGCDPVDNRPHNAGLEKSVGDCSTLPYPDNFFTLVTANMVVEHVEDPRQFASEVHRVLAPGGIFALHTTNRHHPAIAVASRLPSSLVSWFASYSDGRASEDIFPTFYRMNTHRDIVSLPGFDPVEVRCLATGPLLHKLPVLRALEALFIRHAHRRPLSKLQSNWIAVLKKPALASDPLDDRDDEPMSLELVSS